MAELSDELNEQIQQLCSESDNGISVSSEPPACRR